MTQRTHYTEDFKRAVTLELRRSGKPNGEVARKYNINPNTLSAWASRERRGLSQTAARQARPTGGQVRASAPPPKAAAAPRPAPTQAAAEAKIAVLESTLRVYKEAYADLLKHLRSMTSLALPPPPDAKSKAP